MLPLVVVGLLVVAFAVSTRPDAVAASKGPVIDTAVGTGDASNGGDGGPAAKATVESPLDVATAPDGTLYVLAGLRVRAVDPKTKRISTLAGTGQAGFAGDGGQATKARFSGDSRTSNGARGLAVGQDGTVYVADTGNHRIRAIDPEDGTIRTVAGSGSTQRGQRVYTDGGGRANLASLDDPTDVAVTGNTLYIADRGNYRVHAVDIRTGSIETVAGGSGLVPEPDTDRATATRTWVRPHDIAAHGGTVYFTEPQDGRVRAVDVGANTITTVAGEGGTVGGDLTAVSGLAVSADGTTLYVSSGGAFATNERTRVFALDLERRRMRAFAGGGDEGVLGDGGKATDAYLGQSGALGGYGIAAAPGGDVYLTEERLNRVRVVTERPERDRPSNSSASDDIHTLVGSGKKLTKRAKRELADREDDWHYRDVHALDEVDLGGPAAVTVDREGTLYIADTDNARIRAVAPDDGRVRTVAGRPDEPDGEASEGDGGDATDAQLGEVRDLALGPKNTLYLVDVDDGRDASVRVIDLDAGTIDLAVGGPDELDDPTGVAVTDDGTVYVADSGNQRICRRRAGTRSCTTVAGGPARSQADAELVAPAGIAVGPDGTLYVTDPAAGRIRAVQPETGRVSTVAGYEPVGWDGIGATGPVNWDASGDGGPAVSAQLGKPAGIVAGRDGWLYLTDQANHRVRAVHLGSGVIRAVAGTGHWEQPATSEGVGTYGRGEKFGGGGFGGDGGPARSAELDSPKDVAVGENGELYVADAGNNRVRVIGDTSIEPGLVVHPFTWLGGVALTVTLGLAVLRHRSRRTGKRRS